MFMFQYTYLKVEEASALILLLNLRDFLPSGDDIIFIFGSSFKLFAKFCFTSVLLNLVELNNVLFNFLNKI